MCKKSRQHERYNVIAITLRYIFALSFNASTLWRKAFAFDSYRYRHIKNRYRFLKLSLWDKGKRYRFL
jgi:hypothetical protein